MGPVARTSSVDETRDLAAALAELARPSDILVLVGDLGVGKTAFTQGFGRGLGVDEQITSPTFALVRSYTGRLDLYHLDVYRLEQVAETSELGLSELLDDGAVTIIEWGDTIAPALPRDYLEVHIRFDADRAGGADRAAATSRADDDGLLDVRIVEMRAIGARWSARLRALAVATAPWCDVATVDEEGSC
ncbi:MAG: tRNA (adenosine(37)-N6)-threonylcarbamoyltransferase complex ATPase subunit type 1 TsaE [Actinobacteria bacterium]|nr:tRNA (adenosine(37)-N6)-threonylcarbamoyltransferase complex ATPase subunit type 1 TsaE [Actinomycetota bacterium]